MGISLNFLIFQSIKMVFYDFQELSSRHPSYKKRGFGSMIPAFLINQYRRQPLSLAVLRGGNSAMMMPPRLQARSNSVGSIQKH